MATCLQPVHLHVSHSVSNRLWSTVVPSSSTFTEFHLKWCILWPHSAVLECMKGWAHLKNLFSNGFHVTGIPACKMVTCSLLASRRQLDHFALRPQKRGCFLGTGTRGEEDERVKAQLWILPEKDWRDRGLPPEQWKC